MKKIILLLNFLVLSFAGFSQSLTANPTSVACGGTITITGSGESNDPYTGKYFNAFQNQSITAVSPSNLTLSQFTLSSTGITYFNKSTGKPTVLLDNIKNNSGVVATVTFQVVIEGYDNSVQQETPPQTFTFTVTVQPCASIYYNTAQSKAYTKNNCASGYQGSSVTYTVPANKYSSTTSQADADSKATADINANGQNNANANGSCSIVYYNAAASKVFTPTCSSGMTYSGPNVTYTVPANKYNSTVSQADADSKAQADINANGQTYANTHNTGTCSTPTYNITLQNNVSGSPTFQIQFTSTSGGSNSSYSFSSNQTVSIPSGIYTVGMRGSGGNYTFSYGVCATQGSSTGPNATFTNVNVCSSGTFSVSTH